MLFEDDANFFPCDGAIHTFQSDTENSCVTDTVVVSSIRNITARHNAQYSVPWVILPHATVPIRACHGTYYHGIFLCQLLDIAELFDSIQVTI